MFVLPKLISSLSLKENHFAYTYPGFPFEFRMFSSESLFIVKIYTSVPTS